MKNELSAYTASNKLISHYLTQARAQESGVLADADPEHLHQYRVNLRKARSALSLFKKVYQKERAKAVELQLSEWMAKTGGLRDLDVYLADQNELFSLLPSSLHQGLELLFSSFCKQRKQEQKSVSQHLSSAAYLVQIQEVERLFHSKKPMPHGSKATTRYMDYAHQLIQKRYHKLRLMLKKVNESTPAPELHRIRIAGKKLRYLLEFTAPLFPQVTVQGASKQLKQLQKHLGLFNDYSVQQEFLQHFLEQEVEHHPESHRVMRLSESVGALLNLLSQRQTFERAQLAPAFDRKRPVNNTFPRPKVSCRQLLNRSVPRKQVLHILWLLS